VLIEFSRSYGDGRYWIKLQNGEPMLPELISELFNEAGYRHELVYYYIGNIFRERRLASREKYAICIAVGTSSACDITHEV